MPPNLLYQIELRKGSKVQLAWIEGRGDRINAIVEVSLGNGVRDPHWAVTEV